MKKTTRALAVPVLALTALLGCSDTPFQVIEETQFAPALGVDLSRMTKLDNGVYIEDRVVGTGPEIVVGAEVVISFTMWLANGTELDAQQGINYGAVSEDAGVIRGLNTGMLGMLEGGTRLIIVPPEEAYGDEEASSARGVPIPPGSILVFEITADAVDPPA